MPERMRLWNPKAEIPEFQIGKDDEHTISEQFFLKAESPKSVQSLDSSLKDCMLMKEYVFEPFTLREFLGRESCQDTLRCTRLRIQAMDLFEYFKKDNSQVEALVKKYHDENDPKKKIVIKELTKKKTCNLKFVEQIRGSIIEIFQQGQELGDSLDKMFKIVRKM